MSTRLKMSTNTHIIRVAHTSSRSFSLNIAGNWTDLFCQKMFYPLCIQPDAHADPFILWIPNWNQFSTTWGEPMNNKAQSQSLLYSESCHFTRLLTRLHLNTFNAYSCDRNCNQPHTKATFRCFVCQKWADFFLAQGKNFYQRQNVKLQSQTSTVCKNFYFSVLRYLYFTGVFSIL